MSRKSKAEYIGEKRPSAATARPTSSPNCRASALSGELDRGHAGGGMGAFRPTPWLRPRGRPCALHHPVRSPLRPNAEYSNQQLLADVWCYPVGTAFHRRPYHATAPVGTAFHRRPYHVTAPVGTAFHRRPRLAVERQPYLTDQTLQRVVPLSSQSMSPPALSAAAPGCRLLRDATTTATAISSAVTLTITILSLFILHHTILIISAPIVKHLQRILYRLF